LRRQKFLSTVLARFSPESLFPDEATALLFGRLETARRTAEAVTLRLLVNEFGVQSISCPASSEKEGIIAPRPNCTLSRLNRSRVFPPLVPSTRAVREVCFAKLLQLVRCQSERGAPPHELLDSLANSGLGWLTCAQLLLDHGIIPRPIDPEEVEATQKARLFWTRYGEGMARYDAMVRGNKLDARCGDWAFFNHWQLESLLPGNVLADHFRRRQYVTNYFQAPECSVDVYSLTGVPLFKHPFPEKFNPLVFGRARRELHGSAVAA
jgi:hypothetical protein